VLVFGVLFPVAVLPAKSQTVPAAREGSWPLAAGGGASVFSPDFAPGGLMEGATLWVDILPNLPPQIPPGLGFELEGRDISFNRGAHSQNFREDTGLGGFIYSWHRYRGFHPYAKLLLGFGSIDFTIPGYVQDRHVDRPLFAPGAGVDVKIYRHIWGRADYEYQYWERITYSAIQPQPYTLGVRPEGFSFGAMYNFQPAHRR